MTKETLLATLNNKLKGKELDNVYSVCFDLSNIASEMLKEEGFNKDVIDNITCDNYKTNTFFLRYRGQTFCTLNVKRIRGVGHFSWYSNRTRFDWTYGDITSESEDFDFFGEVLEINRRLKEEQIRKQSYKVEMAENYKKIAELFGDKTYGIISYLSRHFWEIERIAKGE